MGSFEPKKLALIRIWQILKENSDYDHPMTQEDIATKLENEYGIVIERKAISRNISLLKESGVEIESRRAGSYLDRRDFEDSELHMLIDGVLSSKHITARHSKDLIDRICSLSNKYFRSSVKHIHSVNDWSKTDNQALFYKTSQQYGSPYLMILHKHRYYLMAYSEYWHNMVFHRLDRITNMTIIDRKATPIKNVPGYENGINYKELSSTMPYMYSDQPEHIDFISDEGIIDQIVDWFGNDVRIMKSNDEKSELASKRAQPRWSFGRCSTSTTLRFSRLNR